MYRLERDVELAVEPDRLWAFIVSPKNLDRITPPELRFRILTEVPEVMYDGLQIRYEIRIPVFGRRRWLTEIRDIVPGRSFIDVQLEGPYRSWQHFHEISETDDGNSRMSDRIDYELPFGRLGEMTHRLIVRSQLEAIFNYREKRLREYFDDQNGASEKI